MEKLLFGLVFVVAVWTVIATLLVSGLFRDK